MAPRLRRAGSMPVSAISVVGVVALALLHVLAGHIHGGVKVRPRWLSAASGVSVAYVFVHLLPELGERQSMWLEARAARPLPWLGNQVYLAALLGLLLALGLGRASRARNPDTRRFWLRTGSFAVYNMLIGGMALRLTGVVPIVLATLAFGAHFLVNDHSLHMELGRAYESTGRWLLAGAIVAGWVVATQLWRPPVVAVGALLGLLSGGIILNVLKEEVREADEGGFNAFLAGALAYAALLLALEFSLRGR